jgi:hypothetical protein
MILASNYLLNLFFVFINFLYFLMILYFQILFNWYSICVFVCLKLYSLRYIFIRNYFQDAHLIHVLFMMMLNFSHLFFLFLNFKVLYLFILTLVYALLRMMKSTMIIIIIYVNVIFILYFQKVLSFNHFKKHAILNF